MHALRSLTWLDELTQQVANYGGSGQLSASVAAGLSDRLRSATKLVEGGSETRALAYVQQFINRANNQIKGDAADIAARDLLVYNASMLRNWLNEAESRENAL
jgi:hypothetical protein